MRHRDIDGNSELYMEGLNLTDFRHFLYFPLCIPALRTSHFNGEMSQVVDQKSR